MEQWTNVRVHRTMRKKDYSGNVQALNTGRLPPASCQNSDEHCPGTARHVSPLRRTKQHRKVTAEQLIRIDLNFSGVRSSYFE